jgi:YesN/AraC family two-component response regulator
MIVTSPPPSRVEPRPARILFVDDERLVLRSLQRLVRVYHPAWEVRCAQSPLSALEALQDFAADVLVTDLSMPEMNGVQLLRTVRELYPSMVRMVYSAHVDSLGRSEFGDLAYAALLKPADSGAVIATLRRVIAHARRPLQLGSVSA